MIEDLVRQLRWPEEAVCGDPLCKWPGHCELCNAVAYRAMTEARVRFLSFFTRTPLERMHVIAMNEIEYYVLEQAKRMLHGRKSN